MTDYNSKAFRGWRENGILHLPESKASSMKSSATDNAPSSSKYQAKTGHGYHRRRSPQSGPKQPKPKRLTPKDRLVFAMTKYPISSRHHLALPQANSRSLRAVPIPSPSVDSKWISRCKMREPQFHSGHSKFALSEIINTSLSEQLEEMGISLQNFTLFPQLPAELRLKIWFFAMPRQRLVEIMVDKTYDVLPTSVHQDKWSYIRTVRSPTRVPAMLHTCHESRLEALKHYHLSFGEDISSIDRRNARIYFDPSVDVLYLNCHRFPIFTFMCLLRLVGKHTPIDSMGNVITMAICHGLAKNLALQNERDRIKQFAEKLNLKKLICIRHGVTLPSTNELVSEGSENPSTTLNPEDIASVESLFGVKLEFGISQMGKSEVRSALLTSLLALKTDLLLERLYRCLSTASWRYLASHSPLIKLRH